MGDSPVSRRRLSPSRAGIPLLGSELPLDLGLSRRDLLKLGGYASVAAFLAACANGSTSSSTGSTTGGKVSLGSNHSDPTELKGMQQIVDAFKKANGDTQVKLNTVDHGTFQDQISSYLQGTPED